MEITALLTGIGLAVASGNRITLPMFLYLVGAKLGYVPLYVGYEWATDWVVLITVAVITLLEMIGESIPFVGNLLSFLAIPLSFVAGTIVMVLAFEDSTTPLWLLSGMVGGTLAVSTKIFLSIVKAVFGTVTAGLSNVVAVIIETITTLILVLLAIFIPLILLIVIPIFYVSMTRLSKKGKSALAERKNNQNKQFNNTQIG